MKPLVLADTDLVDADVPVALLGGKGAGLVALAEQQLPVPAFAVITTAAWEASGGGDEPPPQVAPEVVEALEEALVALGEGPWAVRSSAVVEDSAEASWAGQFDSVLGVDDDGVVDAVRACWASAGGERARTYAELHGTEPGPMAVVVQRMVAGQASGVAFSRTPEDPERAVISVGLGLGEGVVQGRVPCDTFRVARDGTVEADLADKDEATVQATDGVEYVPVDDERRTEPALSDVLVRAIARFAFELEEARGVPVDLEFTVDEGTPWLVQVRPVTAPIPRGRRLLWDNSNIVESYSGITTPLTFSFASTAYTIVYQLFCRVMGVDDDTIREHEPVFRRMIGLVRGRVYYNLNAWYRVLSLLPGFSFNREAMETMMGVSEVASDEEAGEPPPRWLEGLHLVRLSGRLLWRLLWLERDAARFQRTFDDTLERCRARDLDAMRSDELLELYEEIERDLLWGWTPPLVNDFFCMIFYKLLQTQCQELTGDDDTQLHNRLVAGEGTLASAAPATELRALADFVTGLDILRVPFVSDLDDEQVLVKALEHPGFRERWDRWMARYGDRSPDELKLEAPSLRDTPEYVLGTVRAWVRQGPGVRRFGEGERRERQEAEREARDLAGRAWSLPKQWLFLWVLSQARRRIAMRESLRFERTRIFGFVRELFRAFGDRYVEAGALEARDDVFWLSVDEVLGFTRGTAVSTDLRGLVEVRRAEFEAYEQQPAPAERFHTWGAVHVANRFAGSGDAGAVPEGDAIQGTPCSPGRVEAAARVVLDPRERPDLEGGILCAHRTDPGWVPLFPTASAVVVERGSLLSHSAVVARELGLPAVVGARGLLDWVEDGEPLVLDGTTGRVWRPEGPA